MRAWKMGHKATGRFSAGMPYWTQRTEEPERFCNNKPVAETDTVRKITVKLTAKANRAIAGVEVGFSGLGEHIKHVNTRQ
jgi:hypothetical protein